MIATESVDHKSNGTAGPCVGEGTNGLDTFEITADESGQTGSYTFNGELGGFVSNIAYERIIFHGKNGNDTFVNNSNIDSTAYGSYAVESDDARLLVTDAAGKTDDIENVDVLSFSDMDKPAADFFIDLSVVEQETLQ